MHQVTKFADEVTFGRSAVLDDDDPLKVDPEILYPFLDGLLDTRGESLQADFKTATVLG